MNEISHLRHFGVELGGVGGIPGAGIRTAVKRAGCAVGHNRLLKLGSSTALQREGFLVLAQAPPPAEDRVHPMESVEILTEAVTSRRGWKAILRRCFAAAAERTRTAGAEQ